MVTQQVHAVLQYTAFAMWGYLEGKTVTQVSRELSVHPDLVATWFTTPSLNHRMLAALLSGLNEVHLLSTLATHASSSRPVVVARW